MSARDRFPRSYHYQNYKFKKSNETCSYQQSIEILRSDRNSFNNSRPEGPHSAGLVTKSYRHSRYSPELKERQLVGGKRSGYNNEYFDSQPPEKLVTLKEKGRENHDNSSSRQQNRMYEENLSNETNSIRCQTFFPVSKGNCSGGKGYRRSCSPQKDIQTGTHDLEFNERNLYNFEGSRFENPSLIKHCNDLPSQYRPSQRSETDDDSRFNSKETDKYEEHFPTLAGSYGNRIDNLDSVEFKKSNSRNYGLEIGLENSLQYQERCEDNRFKNPILIKQCNDLPSQYRPSRRLETGDDSRFNSKDTNEAHLLTHPGSYGNSIENLGSVELKKLNSRNYGSKIGLENSLQYQERCKDSRFRNLSLIKHCNDLPSQYGPSRKLKTGDDSRFNSKATDKYEEHFSTHPGSYGNSIQHLDSVELKKSNSRNYGLEIGLENSLQSQERCEDNRFKNPILIKQCNDLPSQFRPSRTLETDKYEEHFSTHPGSYGNSIEHLDSVELKKLNSRNYGSGIGLENSLQYQEKCVLQSSEYNSEQLLHEEMDRTRLKSNNPKSSNRSREDQRKEEYLPDHHPGVSIPSDEHVYERRVIYKSHSDLRSPHILSGTMMSENRYSSTKSTSGSETLTNITRTHHGQGFQDSFLDNSNLLKNWQYESINAHPYGVVTRNGVDDMKNNLHEQTTKDDNEMYSKGPKRYQNQYEHDKEQKWRQGNYEMFSLKTNADCNRSDVPRRMFSFFDIKPADKPHGSCQNDIENQAVGRGVTNYKRESEEEEQVPFPKVNLVVPHSGIVNKFKFYPPTAEEMGEMFKGLVIYLPFKINSSSDKSAILSITESFKESAQFDNLQVDDTYHNKYTYLRYSTIRWHGMMLARGLSETEDCSGLSEIETCSESRNMAAKELINKLAQTCYSLKEKPEYFHSGNIQKLVKIRKIPGIFRLVRDEEAPNLEAAYRFIEHFFKDNNDCELMFHCHERMLIGLERYVRSQSYHLRCNKPYLFVSVRRTPQYWCDKMLARGHLEDYRYQLIPPQGFRNDLFQNLNITLQGPEKNKKSRVHPLLWESLQANRYGQQVEDHLIPLANLVTHAFRVEKQQQQDKQEQLWKKSRARVKRVAKKQKKKMQIDTQNEARNQKIMNTQTQNQGRLQSQKQMLNQAPVISKPTPPSKRQLPPGVKKPIFKSKREARRLRRKYFQINRAMRGGKELSQTKTFKKMDEDTKEWVKFRYNV